MTRLITALVLGVTALVSSGTDASAAKYAFGTKDYLNKLQDLTLKGPNGETLYLGHKFSHHSFIAPYRLEDGGYILGVVGENTYFKLTPELIARLQADGQLPKPLPPYDIGLVDYAFGYLAWIVLGLIALGIAWSSFRAKQRAAVQPLLEDAARQIDEGRPGDAIPALTTAIDAAPAAVEPRLLRGMAYNRTGEPDKAIADFSTIIRHDPKHALALFNRALIFMDQQKFEQSLADLDRVARLEKNHTQVLHTRGLAHARLGRPEQAIAEFTAALAIDPNEIVALEARAAQYSLLGRSQEAAADLARLAALHAAAPA